MSHPQPPPVSQEQIRLVCEQFRSTKHDLNNVLAVLLAMAELGERNPQNYERLGKAVLERCPKIVHDMHALQDALFGLLHAPLGDDTLK